MLLIFFYSKSVFSFDKITTLPAKIFLQHEKIPSISTIPINFQYDFDKFDRDLTLSPKSSTMHEEYSHCSISLSGGIFRSNYAFGSTFSTFSGGANFIANSQLLSKASSRFNSNIALSGGAICQISSQSYFDVPSFFRNQGYRHGGAISVHFDSGNYNQPLLVIGGDFHDNAAGQIGGAVFFRGLTML